MSTASDFIARFQHMKKGRGKLRGWFERLLTMDNHRRRPGLARKRKWQSTDEDNDGQMMARPPKHGRRAVCDPRSGWNNAPAATKSNAAAAEAAAASAEDNGPMQPPEFDPRDIRNERYACVREIGHGAYSRVYLMSSRSALKPRESFAMKLLLTNDFGYEQPLELDIMARLRHPYLMPMVDLVRVPQGTGIIMPVANHGDLFSHLDSAALDWHSRVRILFQISCAVLFLHDQGVLHLDIKPQNILLTDHEAMLTDFSLALTVRDVRTGRRSCVERITLDHRAPEHLEQLSRRPAVPLAPNKKRGERKPQTVYTGASDVWSLGMVFLRVFSRGDHLFESFEVSDVARTVTDKFADPLVRRVSLHTLIKNSVPSQFAEHAVDLMCKMLDPVPAQRLTISEVLRHDLFRLQNCGPVVSGRTHNTHCRLQAQVLPPTLDPEEEYVYEQAIEFLCAMLTLVFDDCRAESMFLAFDLCYRSLAMVNARRPIAHVGTRTRRALLYASASLWLALKVVEDEPPEVEDMTVLVPTIEPPLTRHELLQTEDSILVAIQGLLYRPFLFHRCATLGDLVACAPFLGSVSQYLALDIDKWSPPALKFPAGAQASTNCLHASVGQFFQHLEMQHQRVENSTQTASSGWFQTGHSQAQVPPPTPLLQPSQAQARHTQASPFVAVSDVQARNVQLSDVQARNASDVQTRNAQSSDVQTRNAQAEPSSLGPSSQSSLSRPPEQLTSLVGVESRLRSSTDSLALPSTSLSTAESQCPPPCASAEPASLAKEPSSLVVELPPAPLQSTHDSR